MAIQTVRTGAAANDGTGDDARTAFTKINQNFTTSTHAASRLVGRDAGNVMEVGAFGFGGTEKLVNAKPGDISAAGLRKTQMHYFYGHPQTNYGTGIGWCNDGTQSNMILSGITGNLFHVRIPDIDAATREVATYLIRTGKNTSIDGNGFIKAASPIVKLFADKIELNDEAAQQDITFEKIDVGEYLIKGSLGFAQEGWYIEMPKDANGNVLVVVAYEQLANGDISVKTYDYMLNKKGRIVPDLETPLDIPETRWVDLRLQSLPQPEIEPSDILEKAVPDA